MSLFNGTPITANTSSQQTVETPRWLQDAIFNQITTAQNASMLPFQAYTGQLVAGPTQNQTTAWNAAASGQGGWQAPVNQALQGYQNLTNAPGASQTANPYYQQGLQSNPLSAANPYLNRGQGMSATGASDPLLNQGVANNPLSAANPYINRAGQTAAGGINTYMNPYNDQVTRRIAQLGARNLEENLLPSIADSFVQAGQFGGSRMGEFGARALRDTQDSILGQQANVLQSGFNTSLGAAQSDLERFQGLGSLAGNLAGQQQNALLQAAQQRGGFTDQDRDYLLQAGQLSGDLAGQQQNALFNAGQNLGTFANQDRSQQQSLYNSMLGGAQQFQQQGMLDRNELAGFGADQRNIQQQGLQAMYDQYLRSQAYPQQQTNFLTEQLRGLSPLVDSVTRNESVSPSGFNPSTASQILGGLSGIAGLLNP